MIVVFATFKRRTLGRLLVLFLVDIEEAIFIRYDHQNAYTFECTGIISTAKEKRKEEKKDYRPWSYW